jgi:BirA family biotin operon repressor/biotin-[acetyl-CoA-carboxylase] ligase
MFLKDQWARFRDKHGEFEGKISGVSREGKLQITMRNGVLRLFDLKEINFLNN